MAVEQVYSNPQPTPEREQVVPKKEAGPTLHDRGERVLAGMSDRMRNFGSRISGMKDKVLGFARNLGVSALGAADLGVEVSRSAVTSTIGAGHWAYEKLGQIKDAAINRGKEAIQSAGEKMKSTSKELVARTKDSARSLRQSIVGGVAERMYGAKIDRLLAELNSIPETDDVDPKAAAEEYIRAQESGDGTAELKNLNACHERRAQITAYRENLQQTINELSARFMSLNERA